MYECWPAIVIALVIVGVIHWFRKRKNGRTGFWPGSGGNNSEIKSDEH